MRARLLFAAAALVALAVAAIVVFLAWFALPVLGTGALGAVLDWEWLPQQGRFGILPMLVGSLCLALSALLLAFPLGVGLCCFAHGIGPARLAAPLLTVLRFMTSVPTVVYGLAALFLLVPLIRDASHGAGFSWLAAALTLALLILPTIVLMLEHAFREAKARIDLSAAALGFTPAQQVLRLTLPLARRGLGMAAVLGFGRAIGDTLIPLMLAGNAAQLPGSPLDPLRTLTAHIALVLSTDSQSAAYNSLFVCGLLLFLISVLVNLGLRHLRRLREAPHV